MLAERTSIRRKRASHQLYKGVWVVISAKYSAPLIGKTQVLSLVMCRSRMSRLHVEENEKREGNQSHSKTILIGVAP